MQCVSRNHFAVHAYCRHANKKCVPDEHHKCSLQTCKYWQVPGKHHGARWFVCTQGLHVHACSPDGCTLATANYNGIGASGEYYCELSGLQMKARDYDQLPVSKVTNARTGAVSWVKTGCALGKRRKRKASSAAATHTACKRNRKNSILPSHVHNIALSIARSSKYTPKEIVKHLLQKHATKKTFASMLHTVIVQAKVDRIACNPPTYLSSSVAAYCNKVHSYLRPKSLTAIILVATVLSLLQTGLMCNNVEIFPKDAWVAEHMPALTMYSVVPNLQCRQMSVCTRAIKNLVFVNGVVSANFVFAVHAAMPTASNTF